MNAQQLQDLFSTIRIGEPQRHGAMTAFPLFGSPGGDGPSYLTLAEALAAGQLEVREVSEGGSVPQLRAINRAALPVLILDGEELRGAKQNRSVNATLLLAARSETIIPVTCTERGRWQYRSTTFQDSGEFVPHEVRRHKFESVHRSLAHDRAYASDQGGVWEQIDQLSARTGHRSDTSAARDLVEHHRGTFAEYEEALPCLDGQCGLLVALGARIVALDWVSRPAAWAQLHPRVVRSHVLEALAVPHRALRGPSGAAAQAFLDRAATAHVTARPSVGLGTDARLTGEGLIGAALVHEAAVLHLYLLGRDEQAGHDGDPTRRPTGPAPTRCPVVDTRSLFDRDPLETCRIAQHGGITIAELPEGRFILDTGSQVSFGDARSLTLCGRRFRLHQALLGIDPLPGARRELGVRIDGLIGTDVLAHVPLTIDPARQRAIFGPSAPPRAAARLPLRSEMGVPLVTVQVAGRPMRLLLDTGATDSYLGAELLRGQPRDPEPIRDFSPLTGRFETPACTLPLEIAGHVERVRFGELPGVMALLLAMLPGIDGVLGSALWRWGAVTIDIPGREVVILGALARG